MMAGRPATVIPGFVALALGVLAAQLAAPFGVPAEAIPDALRSLGAQPAAAAAALALLAAGGLLLARAAAPQADAASFPDRLPPLRLTARPAGLALLGAAAATLAVLCLLAARDLAIAWYPVLLSAVLALAGFGLRLCDAAEAPADGRDRLFSGTDLAWAALPAVVVGWTASRRLDHWYFSWIGDEVSFFEGARRLIHGAPADIFDLSWVHAKNPLADSLYQSVFMRVLGENVIGWRLAEVAVAVVAAALATLVVIRAGGSDRARRDAVGRLPAVIAGLVVGCSAYTLAFCHIGYTNLHTLVPPLLVTLNLAAVASRPSAVRVFLLGCLLGLCLYTFLATLMIWAVVGLHLAPTLWSRPRGDRLAAAAVALAGVAATTLPVIAAGQRELLHNLAASEAVGVAAGAGVLEGWLAGLGAFWHNSGAFNHHVASSLLDPVAGALAAVGCGAAVLALRHSPWDRFLLLWLVLGSLAVAATHPESWPSFTRLLVVLPAAALLAARGAAVLVEVLQTRLGLSRRLTGAAMGAAVVAIALLNPLQLYAIVPQRVLADPATATIRALQEHPHAPVVEVAYDIDPNRAVSLLPYPELAARFSWTTGARLARDLEGTDPTAVFLVHTSRRLAGTVAEITGPAWRPRCYFESLGGCRIWIFEPAAEATP